MAQDAVAIAYQVTREQGTERAFSQPGYDRHEPGLYRCVCCDNALFDPAPNTFAYRVARVSGSRLPPKMCAMVEDHLFGTTRTECSARCAMALWACV